MADEVTTIRIKGDPAGGVSAFEKVGAAGESAMLRIHRANTGITESAAKMTGVMVGLGSTLAAGAFMQGVRTQLDLADAMDESAQKAGVATSVFSEFAYAGRFAGLETEGMVKVFSKVTDALVKAASGDEKMKALLVDTLQVQVRNASGELRSADAALLDIIDRLSGVSDQGLRTSAAMEIFGEKLGPQLLPLINLSRKGIEDLREEARRLGVVISDEAGAAAGAFKDDLDRLKATQEGIYNQIMTQMLPGLSTLAKLWLDNIRGAGLFRGTLKMIGTELKEAIGVGDMSRMSLDATYAASRVRLIVNQMERLQQLAEKNPGALVEQGYGQPAIRATEKIKQLRKEYEDWQRIAAGASARLAGAANARDGGPNKPKAPEAAADNGSGAALLARIKAQEDEKAEKAKREAGRADKAAQAEARRAAAERAREENEERKRQREAYEDRVAGLRLQLGEWRNNADEQARIGQQIADQARAQFGEDSQEYSRAQQDMVRIRQRAADQQRQIEEELRAGKEAADLAAVASEQAAADQSLALGLITQRERLAQESAFEERLTEVRRKGLQERLQVMEKDPDLNPVERARLQQEILELDRQHQQRKQNIKDQKDQQRAAPGNAVINSFEQSMADQTTRMIMGQQSAMATLQGIWASTSSVFVNEMVTKPLAAWLAGQARMTLATILGVETRVASEATGAVMTEGITAASVVKQIAMKAWSAAAGVYAAIAGIPYVGPFLAPVMAVGAVAAVMAMASNVFSAEGGFDIPAGVNPMVQAHAREMILPAKYADVIRGMATGGGGGGGGAAPQINVTTMDPRNMERWLRSGGAAVIAQELALHRRSRGG